MRTNRFTILTMILMLAVIAPFSFGQAIGESTVLQIDFVNQDPDPAQPGDVVEVRFKIQNEGQQTREDVIVELMPEYPFSVYSGSATKNIGKLRGAQDGSDSVIVDYQLRIDENAAEGEAEIALRVKVDDFISQSFTDKQFTIDIATRNAILAIDNVRTSEQPLEAGKTANVTIMLKNYANSLVENVHATLDLTDTPFAPYDGSSSKRVYQIKPGYQVPLNYELITGPDTESGLYKIPMTLTYEDGRGINYSRSDLISLSVGSTPELVAYVKESTLSGAGRGTITLELANRGLTNLKFLQLTLLEAEHYEILSTSPTIYIGDIDSDDIETEDFDVYIKEEGSTTIPIQLEYRDANNNAYTQKLDLPLRLFTSKEQRAYGLSETNLTPLFLAVLVIAALVWYYLRRRKKKK